MSDNFSLSRILVNEETQTSISLYTDPQVFSISSDKMKLDIENSLYRFKYSIEEVERLVSAVQGDDISIRNKGKIISPKSKRFHKLLESLKKQIQTNSRYLHTYREQKILTERLIRSLAYAIDPASRYSKNRQNKYRIPLFSHQKYEHSMKLGCASLFYEDPEPFGNENKDFDIVFSYQNSLCLTNNSYIFVFDHISPNSLITNQEIPITYRKQPFGSIILYDYPEEEDKNTENEENEDSFIHHKVIMPIIDDDRTLYLVHGLGSLDSGSGKEINLKALFNPYDFSFIDIILSIPRLTATEATDFLIFLYKENYLSAYVRSKLCQFLYENRVPEKDIESETLSVKRSSKSTQIKVNLKRDLITNSLKSREWPELLGRFITLLDHPWFIEAAHRMESLELPQVVKSIAKSSDGRNADVQSAKSAVSTSNPVSPINSAAQYLLGIIFWEYESLGYGETTEFVWEFLCKSVFANLYLNKYDERSIQKRQKLEALYLGTKEKPPTSKTRIVTQKAVERISKIVRTTKLDDIIPRKSSSSNPKSKSPKSPIESFNSQKFLLSLIKSHRDEIITVLKNIPRTTEEASPLFYPIALEVRDALYSNFDEFARSRSSRAKPRGETSNYEYVDYDAEIESQNSQEEIKSSKNRNKARASSLQRTNKSSRKQSRKRNNNNNNNDDHYSDEVDDTNNRSIKNKSGHRASSVTNKSQSSNSKPLNARRPSPLKLKKQGRKLPPRPASNKNSQKQKQQQNADERYEEDYDVEYEYEYEEDLDQ